MERGFCGINAKSAGGMMTKRKQSKLEAEFSLAWRIYGTGVTPLCERTFAASIGRRWRFDFAFPGQMVAVEIDGGQYAYRGGRHNTDEDRDKLNHAACLGWRVLRFSGSMLKDPERVCQIVRWALGEEPTTNNQKLARHLMKGG